ncbi:metal ABC transporter solute-binding protein, Zn/Mn family [Methylosinus sp. LW4]|uniref:metal ABC transporter solute-binding protein, Zn/Mn family n=1 Tax=Methylosinus sp. LW4 TaxID=136993 RepID=UPI000373E58D|nr:zinc ABC transporter substrate-binding protein [Methylosinus sp. LW4]
MKSSRATSSDFRLLSRRAALATLALLAAPLRAQPAPPPPPKLPVVASFSILGDLVRIVGGDRIEVATIVGPNGDAHVYQPSPQDGRRLAAAKLVFVNGLGFEGWIDRLVAASRTKARIVAASRAVTPRKDGEGVDPHAWQDVANVKIYIANIRDALVDADPDGASHYKANAAEYLHALGGLDAEIVAAIDAIPHARRRVVSTHDAFGYFAARYGVEFIAPQGVSTDAEASARDLARIVDAVKAHKVAAVFLENIVDPRFAQRIAAETGAKVGGTLYSDALSPPEGPAPSYLRLMRFNVKQLTAALAP